jgi:ribosomal protein S27AE
MWQPGAGRIVPTSCRRRNDERCAAASDDLQACSVRGGPGADNGFHVVNRLGARIRMKEETIEWVRRHAELIGVAFMVLGGVVAAFVAALVFPNVGKTAIAVGVAVSVLAFAAFFVWARFPVARIQSSTTGIPTLTIGQQLRRTRALFQRIVTFVLIAWVVGVTLLAPNLTAAERNGLAMVGALVLSFVGWLLVRNRLRCPRCGTDFKKERITKLGRWSMDTRGTADLWDACPRCGANFNEPYR